VSDVTNWYVQTANPDFDEEFIGPLRPTELLKLVREGKVGPDHLVRKDDSAWFEAREVGGLFEAAMRPTINLYCPRCSAQVADVPTVCPKCGVEIVKAREEITENTILKSGDQSLSTQAGRSVQNWLNKKVRRKDKERGD
jgi:hypothetical protein